MSFNKVVLRVFSYNYLGQKQGEHYLMSVFFFMSHSTGRPPPPPLSRTYDQPLYFIIN